MQRGAIKDDQIIVKLETETQLVVQGEVNFKTLQFTFQKLLFDFKQCNVLTIRDMSDIEKVYRVEAENKILNQYTASVTHEMITPLKCIVQFGSTLLKSKDVKVVKEAELIVSTAQLLLSEVKLVLDKNMLDNNMFTPIYEFFPLKKTILEVVKILEAQAALQDIKFEVSLPQKETTVLLDQLRLQQVILNLISNAIKFSKPQDIIEINVSKKTIPPKEANEIEIEIKVTDYGIGISPKDLENLF